MKPVKWTPGVWNLERRAYEWAGMNYSRKITLILFPNQMYVLLLINQLPPAEHQILTFTTANFNSCLKLQLSSSNPYFCVVYRLPTNADRVIFDLLSSNIERLLTADFRSSLPSLDLIIQNRQWLVHSSDKSVMRLEAEQFAVVKKLSQLVDPMCVPDLHFVIIWQFIIGRLI